MDRLSTPGRPSEGTFLTKKMLEDGLKAIFEGWELAEEKRRRYYATLRPLLDRLKPDDYKGMLAVVKLIQSGFYEPIHPDDAKWCLGVVRDRGFKDWD